MKTNPECIPCFVRQTLETIKLTSDDSNLHESALREILRILSRMDFAMQPVLMGRKIHRLARRLSGNADPYLALKRKFNRMALALYPQLKMQVSAAENPFEMAARLALAGNMIDFGTGHSLQTAEVQATIKLALSADIYGDIDTFHQIVSDARSILYLGDNCGEIVFDRLLIEQLATDRVTYVVRAAPIINDVTMADARMTGMTEQVRVIDSGSDAPGTLLSECSEEFKTFFDSTDVIIAKGQGNYETLHASNRPIFFLLKVKCPVVANHIGHEIGSYVIEMP